VSLDLPALLGRVYYRYPSFLVDAVTEHDSGRRIEAIKNVTVNEEFFQGHFPGSPVMPAVLMIEALTQLAAVLILDRADAPPTSCASLRGVDGAKFRRLVVPGIVCARGIARPDPVEAGAGPGDSACGRIRCGRGGVAPRHRGGGRGD